MNFDHLTRAPITEAVLDVRVRARPGVTASDFRPVHDLIAAEYPKIEERRQVTALLALIDPNKGQPLTTSSSIDGYFFRSEDGFDVAQFRTDGFSINRLRPYQGWDHFFPKFQRLWPLYVSIAKPLAATRVASRCINHIPGGRQGVLEDYFSKPPGIPSGIPGRLKSFRTNLSISDDGDPPHSVNLSQALQLAPDGRSVQFLLDVDAFTVGEFEPSIVVSLLDPLHELRNTAFFQSLTPQQIDKFR